MERISTRIEHDRDEKAVREHLARQVPSRVHTRARLDTEEAGVRPLGSAARPVDGIAATLKNIRVGDRYISTVTSPIRSEGPVPVRRALFS